MRLVGVSQGRRGKAAHVLGEKGSSGNCVDDPFWVDSFGNKCIDYVSEDYCRDGGYGPGWGNLGTFFDRASMDGIDASKVSIKKLKLDSDRLGLLKRKGDGKAAFVARKSDMKV